MTQSSLLSVTNLWKSYRGRGVLRGISFEVYPGEAVGIVGPNGAGKSTMLGCITGDRLPDRGEIRICGADPFSDLATTARCMGFVPEQPFLYGELTVDEMLGFVAEARDLERAGTAAEIARLMDLLGLTGAGELLCRELSQGMGRKVALIAGLLHRPNVLVLDEAFNGLDRASTEHLVTELEQRRENGSAVLLSSHDLDFMGSWCNRGLLLAGGASSLLLEGDEWRQWQATGDGPIS